MIRLGIYGYECTKEYKFNDFKITPLYKRHSESYKLAKDKDAYHLTAFVEYINGNTKKLNIMNLRSEIHDLEAVLSFIDHRDVIISNELREHETYDNLDMDYPRKIISHQRKNGGGCVIINDAFSSDSRETFIALTMKQLQSESNPINESFRKAFFKTIEVFRARESFIDISYYLLFSALESLCRAKQNDYKSKCSATPIKNVLTEYGFDIKQENKKEPCKSIMTYVHLRNALFHNGELTAKTNDGDIFEMKDYYPALHRLLPLILIKHIGFDDNRINWNSWLDRIPFKS
ncbi:hypothetical protein B6J47_00965 [Klebsiella pneumoniae]|uniref:hypothetical protein n=1 Tax=Enterobacteriaceae TaxID=543 RepID=UPI00032EDD7B|nr:MULTISPECIES: hypothetical protein [Enterobacteriaceae]HDU6182396.1 hypothetical protein [Klebsiella variicola]EJG2380221.1 hypothetical protein [Raoultella ornithinolytica]ELA1012770.1 hypothetical protein [Klebsiella pneumoniae]EOQ47715.1 hypothetical protein A1WC_04191 [Klebsiella sp. KTE92]MBK2568669.1 hypothetical protein [Klebsiella pneumoniae]